MWPRQVSSRFLVASMSASMFYGHGQSSYVSLEWNQSRRAELLASRKVRPSLQLGESDVPHARNRGWRMPPSAFLSQIPLQRGVRVLKCQSILLALPKGRIHCQMKFQRFLGPSQIHEGQELGHLNQTDSVREKTTTT